MKKLTLALNRHFGVILGAHGGPNQDNGWEVGLNLIVGVRGWFEPTVFVVGWGYDDPVPLRPWPQFWLFRKTKRGNTSSGVAWCGFFSTVGRSP